MIPGAFEYHRPASVDDVISLLGQYGDEGRVLAGGHSLIPMMKMRFSEPTHLIDLRGVDELKGIREADGGIVIGAMTTQHEVIQSELLADHCPILGETARLVSDPQVRYCGTIGGNVASGDPANDMPAVMQCLGAGYVLRGPGGERRVAARDYYRGVYDTALGDGELLTGLSIPLPPAGHGHAYEKLKRKVGDYAIAAAAVVLAVDGGRCSHAAIALTNVGPTPLYAEAAGQALTGSEIDEAAVDKAVELARGLTEPAADMRGPADYRSHVAGIMVRRAIVRARERAGG
ncbi:MAG: FAD binding domain-containing protein [Kiloniellales bacterium]